MSGEDQYLLLLVVLQLLNKLLLMLLVYVFDYFGGYSRLFGALNIPSEDIGCKNKPNAAVVVLCRMSR